MTVYSAVRHFADSYGFAVICALYLTLRLWHFRLPAKPHIADARNLIFKDDDND